jgi:PKD repeat protein
MVSDGINTFIFYAKKIGLFYDVFFRKIDGIGLSPEQNPQIPYFNIWDEKNRQFAFNNGNNLIVIGQAFSNNQYLIQIDKSSLSQSILDIFPSIYIPNHIEKNGIDKYILCGRDNSGNNALISYDATLQDTIWSRSYSNQSDLKKFVFDIDSSYIYPIGIESNNVIVRKISRNNGQEIWSHSYNGPSGLIEIPTDIEYNKNLNQIVFTGYQTDTIAGSTTKNVFIETIDTSGNVINTYIKYGNFDGENKGLCIKALNDGSIWVGGNINDSIHGKAGFICEIDSAVYCQSLVNVTHNSACTPYISPSGNYSWTTSGVYLDTIYSTLPFGCDSLFEIHLIIPTIDTSLYYTNNTSTLNSSEIGASYQWFNCNIGLNISGAINQNFTPDSSGFYAVIIDVNGCLDTSSCLSVNVCNINSNYTFTNNGSGNYSFTNNSTGNFNQSHWAFGDGTIDSIANPNHTFTTNGFFTVILTILDSTVQGDSCVNYFIDTINVTGVANPLPCHAGFAIYPDSATGDINVVNSATGNSLTYLWNFGDGNTSTLQNPSHTYVTAGPFYLCLTIDDGNGCTDMYCDSIGKNGVIFNKTGGFNINVSSPNTTGIDNINLNREINIYPNPTSNQLTITTGQNISEVAIIDITGKTIMVAKENTNTLNVTDLSDGIYFIQLITEERTITKKFVKQ